MRKEDIAPEESKKFAEHALDLYKILEFSNIFYAKKQRFNPFSSFLEDLIVLGARLDRDVFNEMVHEGPVYEWFPGNEYVNSGFSVDNTVEEECWCLLNNCFEEIHYDLLLPAKNEGRVVIYSKPRMVLGQYHYEATLIDTTNKVAVFEPVSD